MPSLRRARSTHKSRVLALDAWIPNRKGRWPEVEAEDDINETGVAKDNLGFGERSWRYACIVNNGKIEKWFIEPGMEDNAGEDPYGETSPENILNWLKENG